MSEKTRAWLYRIGVAVVPLLTAYGLVGTTQAALWLGVLGAALGTGLPLLAAANTSTKGHDEPPTLSRYGMS
jgi:hypothetical protein